MSMLIKEGMVVLEAITLSIKNSLLHDIYKEQYVLGMVKHHYNKLSCAETWKLKRDSEFKHSGSRCAYDYSVILGLI